MISMNSIYLKFYKAIGFTLIFSISGFIFTFAFLMAFFTVASNWVAPTVLSASSDKMLQFTAGYEQALQNEATLIGLRDQAERELKVSGIAYSSLLKLQDDVRTYGTNISKLKPARLHLLDAEKSLADELIVVEQATKSNVARGLLTKVEATSGLASIKQYQGSTSDQEMSLHTLDVTMSSNLVQLQTQLNTAESDVKTKQETLYLAQKNLIVSEKALSALEQSAYKRAFDNSGANLAFLPYDNTTAVVGANVYSCRLLVLVCSKVGTITKIYRDEQIVEFPIFDVKFTRVVRGILIEMAMTDNAAMTNQLLYTGHKPLWVL